MNNNHLSPFEKQQRIAEKAHEEYQGRQAAIGYICVLVLGWCVLTFFDVPVLSAIVHLFNDLACGLFDAVTDRTTQTAAQTYTKSIQDGHEVFVPVAQTKPEKGFSKLPFLIVILLLLFGFYQTKMANRAHGRWAFFGDHNDEHH